MSVHVDAKAYNDSIARAQDQAREFVRYRLSQVEPGASVDEIREEAQAALSDAYEIYGYLGASLAADLYDQVGLLGKLGLKQAEPWNEYDEGAIERFSYLLRDKFLEGEEPDLNGFVEMIANKAAQRVLAAANRTVERATGRPKDYAKGMRWAWVPTSKNPCGFCIVLASRGFVYTSQAAAGDNLGPYNRYHDHCTCKAIPGFDGMQLDGYDDAGYLKQYEAAKTEVGNTYIEDLAKAIDKANGRQAHKKKK